MARMTGIRAVAAAIVVAAPLGLAPKAEAALTTALYLAMDGSGSISNANFTTQVNAYHSALDAFFLANPAAFGQVAIGGSVFGGTIFQFSPLTVIASQAVLDTLTATIVGLDPGRGSINTGATGIGNAIAAAATALTAFETAQGIPLKLLIDVTTDGQNNIGTLPGPASTAAYAAGIDQVNCLGIGGGADCSWVVAPGIDFGNVNFADLSTALTAKLKAEIIGVPEPTTLALLGFGIAALGVAARRRKAA